MNGEEAEGEEEEKEADVEEEGKEYRRWRKMKKRWGR